MPETPSFGIQHHADAPESEKTGSFLDEVHDDLAAEVHTPPVSIPVNTRKGYSVVFSTELDAHLLKMWQKRFTQKGELDELRLAHVVLSNQCLRILKNGQVLADKNGFEITFGSPDFLALTGTSSGTDAVRKFYVQDGLITATAGTVLSQCGYDAEVGVDPTTSFSD